MKCAINDSNGVKWVYDTKQSRFYVDDPVVEAELGEQNGYICEPKNLCALLLGPKSVADFDRKLALIFCMLQQIHDSSTD